MPDPQLARAQDLLARAHTLNGRKAPARALRLFRELERLLLAAPGAWPEWTMLRVRGLIGQASAVVERNGDTSTALALLAAARTVAEEAGDRQALALVHGQTATVRTRLGQYEGAFDAFGRALALQPARYDAALLHLNRGSAAIELRRLAAAQADFDVAADLAREVGYPILEGMALHNSAYVRFLRGDLPSALRLMEQASELVPEDARAVGYLDKARVLVEAGLLADAETTLERAAAIAASTGMTRDLAEIDLMRSSVLVGLRLHDRSIAAARSARRRFARMGSTSWALQCELAVVRSHFAKLRVEGGSRTGLRQVARDARDLADRASDSVIDGVVAVEARLIAGEALVAVGDIRAARAVDAVVPRRLTELPIAVRVQRHAVRAQLAFAEGRRAAGLRSVRQGLALLAERRSSLGAVESMTAAAVHGVHLNRVDVDAAIGTGRPSAVFDALERGRATFAGPARVTPPDDAESAELLATARALLARARELAADRDDPAAVREQLDLSRRARAAQDRLRERSWQRAGGAGAARPVTSRELVGVLAARGDGAVVASLVVRTGRVLAVRVDGTGTRLLDLADAADVGERVRRIRADLAISSNTLIPPRLREVALASLSGGLRRMDELLVSPLRADADLYVAAREPFVGLPWSSFPSRRGLRTAVNSHVARGCEWNGTGRDLTVVAAAGPDVPHAEREVRAVASAWPGGVALLGADATTSAVRGAVAGSDVVHLAAHGRHDADNPLFACLELRDGPLFAYELDGLQLPRSVVVLSACEVGGATPGLGGEVLGLTSVLLRLGARAVVASVAPLSDATAAEIMPRLHERLRATDDPEGALAQALAAVDEPVPLVCFSSVAGLAEA